MSARRRFAFGFAVVAVLGSAVAIVVLFLDGAFARDVWTRESPLQNPISVAGVRSGLLKLANGTEYRPAGVARNQAVSEQDFDHALRVITRQGVEVERDLGDGRALLTAEPKFYNWCGTRSGWTRWAGTYQRCSLSEVLVLTGYADPVPEEVGLTPMEARRIHGMRSLRTEVCIPTEISDPLAALRFDGSSRWLDDESVLDRTGTPPPQ